MVKPSTKQGKVTTALPLKKSSQNLVDALTGKTNPRTQGAAISKKSPITCSWSLSTHNSVPKTIKTHSSSVKSVPVASEVGLQSGDGKALAAGQISHSRKVSKFSKSKVVGPKSLGSTLRFPPPISRKMGVQGRYNNEMHHQETSTFLQQDTSAPIHLLGSSGPGTLEKLLQNQCS